MKRFIALMLVVIMVAAMFTACKNEQSRGEATTITYFASGDRLEGEKLASDPIVEYIEQKFNVNFEFVFEPSPTETEVYQKLNMWMADGKVPDVMLMRADLILPYTCMEDLVEAGFLLDIEQHVNSKKDQFPNMSKLLARNDYDTFRASDDHLYMLPREYVYDHVYIYRQDWLDELGLEMPTNEVEFKNVLQKFVEKDPDGQGTTGLSMTYGFWFEHIFAGFVGAHRFYEQDGVLRSVWDAEGERADGMMAGLQYCIDLYNEGLLYKDVFTSVQNRDELALFESGRAGVLLTGADRLDRVYTNLKTNYPDAEISFGVWNGPAGQALVQSGSNYYLGTAINAQSGKADLIMEILEYLMSEEGQKLLTQGIEGVHYNVGADGAIEPIMDAEGIEYLTSMYKHPLKKLVGNTAVFDEFVYTREWTKDFEEYYDKYCLNSTAVFDMTDGYFSRMPKRVSSRIGNDPELTLQKWEGYFITGKANGIPITLTKSTFAEAWADLKLNKMETLAEEYTKLLLGK